WLSTWNGRKGPSVISFSPTEFEPGTDQPKAVWVGTLTENELKLACDKIDTVQTFTDNAAAAARLDRKDWSPSGFGTEVHTRVAHAVNGKDEKTGNFRSPARPENPDFLAEFSALKTRAANRDAPPPRWGQKGTIRVDVLENREREQTVCVYDIKTGER